MEKSKALSDFMSKIQEIRKNFPNPTLFRNNTQISYDEKRKEFINSLSQLKYDSVKYFFSCDLLTDVLLNGLRNCLNHFYMCFDPSHLPLCERAMLSMEILLLSLERINDEFMKGADDPKIALAKVWENIDSLKETAPLLEECVALDLVDFSELLHDAENECTPYNFLFNDDLEEEDEEEEEEEASESDTLIVGILQQMVHRESVIISACAQLVSSSASMRLSNPDQTSDSIVEVLSQLVAKGKALCAQVDDFLSDLILPLDSDTIAAITAFLRILLKENAIIVKTAKRISCEDQNLKVVLDQASRSAVAQSVEMGRAIQQRAAAQNE